MNQQQFEHTAKQLRMKAWQTASRMLNDSDDADDVASETMLRLWAVHDTLHDETHAVRLAVVVARHTAIDHQRRRRPSVSMDSGTRVIPLDIPTTDTPDRKMEWEESEQWLRQRIEQLPPREMQVLRLRQTERRTNAEIAALLGIGEASVATMLSAARRKLFNDIKERNRQ